MKWLGQYIQDLPSRFRSDVYLESISTTTETNVLVVDSDGKVSKSTTLADDIIESEIDTLAGLTSFGSAGATTNILAGDIDWYNPVTDGNPRLKFGFDNNERFSLQPFYSGNSLATVIFKTVTAATLADMGKFRFNVDGTIILDIDDGGIDLYTGKGIAINGTDILTDSSGTATLGNLAHINIDTDRSAAQGEAGAENITALTIDFDRTVPSGLLHAHNDIGIDLDVTSASLGTSSLKGMDIDVVGATSGTSTAYGIDLTVSGADTNSGMHILCEGEQLRLSHNAADYATFTVADTGDLKIATVGDGTTDSDLTLDADGQIKLEPAGGNNILLDRTLTVDGGVIIPLAAAHDTVGTTVGIGAGATTAGTTNNIAGGHLIFAGGQGKGSGAGGDIIFKTANAGSSGSTLNSLATALTISDDLSATFAGTIVGDVTGDLTGTVITATQPNIESIGTDGDSLSVLGDTLIMQNTTTNKPEIQLINFVDDATGPRFSLTNKRKSSGFTPTGIQPGQDSDTLGTIIFQGYDSQPLTQDYAAIVASIDVALSGEESGKLALQVANHDGGLGSGLVIRGGGVDNEVNVVVGLGATSVTAIAGDMTVTGDVVMMANLPTSDPSNAGQLWANSGVVTVSAG